MCILPGRSHLASNVKERKLMKRKNLALFAAFAVSLSAGCARNRNPESVQETAVSAAETVHIGTVIALHRKNM